MDREYIKNTSMKVIVTNGNTFGDFDIEGYLINTLVVDREIVHMIMNKETFEMVRVVHDDNCILIQVDNFEPEHYENIG